MATLSAREATENAFSLGAEHNETGQVLDTQNAALQAIISASDMPVDKLKQIYKEGYQDGLITF